MTMLHNFKVDWTMSFMLPNEIKVGDLVNEDDNHNEEFSDGLRTSFRLVKNICRDYEGIEPKHEDAYLIYFEGDEYPVPFDFDERIQVLRSS